MGDSSPEYDAEYARIAEEVRAEVKELAEDEQNFFSDDDPADRGWSTYVTDANAFFAGRRIKPKAWRFYYDRGLCARLALYCYNLQKGTAYDFRFISQLHEQITRLLSFTKSFITCEVVNQSDRSPLTFETCVKHIDDQVTYCPSLWWETHICRVEGSEEADYEWNDGAIDAFYKGEMPKWFSDDHQQRCYVVEQSELHDGKNGWLALLTEFAFFTKWNGPLGPGEIEDCRPLITQHVVVETLGEGEKEPRDKLNAPNAIFYISFECVEDPTEGRYRAVVRKTMDGKPGHMRLEVTCQSV